MINKEERLKIIEDSKASSMVTCITVLANNLFKEDFYCDGLKYHCLIVVCETLHDGDNEPRQEKITIGGFCPREGSRLACKTICHFESIADAHKCMVKSTSTKDFVITSVIDAYDALDILENTDLKLIDNDENSEELISVPVKLEIATQVFLFKKKNDNYYDVMAKGNEKLKDLKVTLEVNENELPINDIDISVEPPLCHFQ